MASLFVAVLGDTLLRSNGDAVKTSDALAAKTVGLYFSAHWCPPCVPCLGGRRTSPHVARRAARAAWSRAAALARE
jgi:hypothetical protein